MEGREEIIRVSELDPDIIRDLKILPKGRKKRSARDYLLEPMTFDIESTNLPDIRQAVMYIWQWQLTAEITVVGRSWAEFRQLIDLLEKNTGDVMIVVYVHNLSYEFQFIKSILPIESVFATDARRILRVITGKIEFRCSYIHSNMSLRKFLDQMNVPDRKLSYDYDKIRYPWTDLSPAELAYCVNDVKGLREALIEEMSRDKDTLYSIPLTSTGYIRREAKIALSGYSGYIHRMLPGLDLFLMLLEGFRGGNTHANRYNAERIIKAWTGYPINEYDISSSYPSVLLSELYPTEFIRADPDMLDMLLRYGKACLMEIKLFNIRLKDERWPVPYISLSKCRQADNPLMDNGRIIEADAVHMVINEIDLEIIREEYSIESFECVKLYTANKRRLPVRFRLLLLEMYRVKTELKGKDEYLYSKTKNKFNSFYGMTVQNPCRPEMIWKDGAVVEDESVTIEDLMKKYQQTGWLPYQWGVWCTSYARRKLEDGIRLVDKDAFLYCDTDSIYCVGDYDEAFSRLNERYKDPELCARDANGQLHYIGIFEKENKIPIEQFITMGAKKYCYTDRNGLHLTVSGVSKKEGAEELGTIENFREGFVFEKAGGLEAVYNDDPEIKSLMIDGHRLDITSNVYLGSSTYTLSIGYDYRRLLNMLANIDIRRDVYHDYSDAAADASA